MTRQTYVLDIHVFLTLAIADFLLIVMITTWEAEGMRSDDLEMPRKRSELEKSLTALWTNLTSWGRPNSQLLLTLLIGSACACGRTGVSGCNVASLTANR